MKNSLTSVLAIALTASGASGAIAAKKESARQVVDRFFEVVDSKQIDRLSEVDAANLIMTTPMGAFTGPQGHGQMLKGFGTAFPNFKHTTTRCVEAGDEISCEGTFSGDHTGPMMMPDGKAIPPTKKHVEFPYVGFAKVKGGKVAQLNVYFDVMSLIRQLGLVPPAPKTASK
jgi:predicted ester cyclase